MDIQRYLLIGASAFIAVMLLGEWTAFKAERTQVQDRERLSMSSPAMSSPSLSSPALSSPQGDLSSQSAISNGTSEAITDSQNVATDLAGAADIESTLAAADTPDSGDADLPDVSVQASANTPPAIDTSSNTRQLIQVSTDALSVVIDLVGGDVVEVALKHFPETLDNPDLPFVILEQNNTRTYVAQSGLVGPDGIDVPERARYTASQSSYTSSGTGTLEVPLTTIDTENAVTVTKTFTFEPDSYVIGMRYDIANNGARRWQAVPFGQLKRDSTLAPASDSSGFGMQPFLGAATTTPDDRFKKFSFEDIADDPWKANLEGGWIALLQHYFLSAWIPDPAASHNYSTRQTRTGFNIAGFTSPALVVDPGQTASYAATLYVGPKDQYALAEISPHLDLTVDYGWLWWIAQPLFWLLTMIQSLVSNWGVAIILLTVLVKAAFFQLSATSYRSMAKMRKVGPKMQSIREQYADDKQKQSQAMMELYKKEKINPMGGCLPILIQMPVFIALYWVLMESVELRQAPFALWIDDLSVMDPYFVLPLLMGGSMYFMQKLNPPPPDPMQAKIMQWLPVMFTFFFLWFPAGLVLYWVVNNLLSMAQQWVITKKIENEGAKA